MKKLTLTAILCLSPLMANANTLDSCGTIKKIQFAMDAVASNIANVETTRTPEGGAYRRKIVTCGGEHCEVTEDPSVITKYLPDHIDASEAGYVEFPDMNIETELNSMVKLQRAYEDEIINCPAPSIN